MVQTRAELKRKGVTALYPRLQEPRRDTSGIPQRTKTEEEFFRKYGTAFVTPRDDQHLLNCGVTSLIATGLPEWAFDPKGLEQFHWAMKQLAYVWTREYLIADINPLPTYQIRRLITSVEGYCAQLEWTTLRGVLPPPAADHFGEILGELLIDITVHELFCQNPFWYLDGKSGPDDRGDPDFARRLGYLSERFYICEILPVRCTFLQLLTKSFYNESRVRCPLEDVEPALGQPGQDVSRTRPSSREEPR
jgi:hypothetical protein